MNVGETRLGGAEGSATSRADIEANLMGRMLAKKEREEGLPAQGCLVALSGWGRVSGRRNLSVPSDLWGRIADRLDASSIKAMTMTWCQRLSDTRESMLKKAAMGLGLDGFTAFSRAGFTIYDYIQHVAYRDKDEGDYVSLFPVSLKNRLLAGLLANTITPCRAAELSGQKKNCPVISLSLSMDLLAFEYASHTMRNDKNEVAALVEKNGDLLAFASRSLRRDQDVVLRAVKNKGLAIRHADLRVRYRSNIVSVAVQNDGLALQYAGHKNKENKDITLAAVCQNGLALQYVSSATSGYLDIVRSAVRNDPRALDFAAASVRNDPESMLEFIAEVPPSIQFATVWVRDSATFMLEAVLKDPRCLGYATSRLRLNDDFMLEAIRRDWRCFQFASAALKNNAHFVRAACATHPEVGERWKNIAPAVRR